MYAILVTGIPAAGKSTMAGFLAEKLKLPVISKDSIKELLFDSVGFRSREVYGRSRIRQLKRT